jgi:hypothetical protein
VSDDLGTTRAGRINAWGGLLGVAGTQKQICKDCGGCSVWDGLEIHSAAVAVGWRRRS